MSKKTFRNLFYLFTAIFFMDFALVILGSILKSCEECVGKEALVLIPILSIFWFAVWGFAYVVSFYHNEEVHSKRRFFISKWYCNGIRSWLKNKTDLMLVRVVQFLIIFVFCLGAVWAFINFSNELMLILF